MDIPREDWLDIYTLCGRIRPSLHPEQENIGNELTASLSYLVNLFLVNRYFVPGKRQRMCIKYNCVSPDAEFMVPYKECAPAWSAWQAFEREGEGNQGARPRAREERPTRSGTLKFPLPLPLLTPATQASTSLASGAHSTYYGYDSFNICKKLFYVIAKL